MDVNTEGSTEQNGGDEGEITNIPLVFLQERDLFGFPKPNDAYLKHEEMYAAVGEVIEPSHITGLQRVNGLWRIYIENLSDKAKLMVSGVSLRGKLIPIKQTNPFLLDSERVTRIRIQNIPLSADDNIIKHDLILKGLEIRSFIREKLRINGKLTNCSTGDRLVTVKSLSLKEPLHRFMQFGIFKAKVIHKGQVNPALKCKKCLSVGHVIADCKNDWKCVECGQTGHKKGECELLSVLNSASDVESDTESESDAGVKNIDAGVKHIDTDNSKSLQKVTAKTIQDDERAHTQTNKVVSPEEHQVTNTPKRRKKKAKAKQQNDSSNASYQQTEISKYFRQNLTTGTPNNNKTKSVMRSPISPLDDPCITKKTCIS